MVAYAPPKGGADNDSGIWTEVKAVCTPTDVAFYAMPIANGIKNANAKPYRPSDSMLDGGLLPGGV